MLLTEDYHFHVYYDASSKSVAKRVIAKLCQKFSLVAGSFHDQPVGPHPLGSCQVSVDMAQFGAVMDWMALNRQGLTIFIHANTGDVMRDHTDHTIWMGEMMTLDLGVLRQLVEGKR